MDISQDERAQRDADLNMVMTASEVNDLFNLKDSRIRKAIQYGALKARKSGDRWLIHRQDAIDYFADKSS